MKRQNYLSWQDYFMGLAILSAQRSKDPNTQVGSTIVSSDNRIISVGYNGFPKGCDDDILPWEREAKNPNDTKYPYVVHAEANAILNSGQGTQLRGCSLYTTLYPCNECAKLIIQSGIKVVCYLNNLDSSKFCSSIAATRILFRLAEVDLYQFDSKTKLVKIRYKP